MDVILKNALVAHEDQPVRAADIAIEGACIVAVEPGIAAEAGEVIDCGGGWSRARSSTRTSISTRC